MRIDADSQRETVPPAVAPALFNLFHSGAAALAATMMFAAAATAGEIQFEGGIGSQPLRAGTPLLAAQVNDVNGVPPGGRPWVISKLTAEVADDGRIRVDGRGLLLAGGPAIGTPAGQKVRARLYCDNVLVGDSSPLVPLKPNGDFRIDSALSGPMPNLCKTPVLLIINAGSLWFAAGIPNGALDAGAELED